MAGDQPPVGKVTRGGFTNVLWISPPSTGAPHGSLGLCNPGGWWT
jgi:hypothetical protein